jgi:hypothetical protein
MIDMLPLDRRRRADWELSFRRTTHRDDIWEDDWSVPMHDAVDLAVIPELLD